MKIRYTAEQLEFLRIAYRYLTVRDLTTAFNAVFAADKTDVQIRSTLKRNGIKSGHVPKLFAEFRLLRVYTSDQAQFLLDNYAGRSVAELTAIFNDNFRADMTEQQIKSFVHNRGITCGRSGRFEKGHQPWNAGTKGKGLTGANARSFRKGSIPANRKPLGSERIDSKNGYIYIKVAEPDPHTGFPTRYKQKHVYVWEQAHGPVPDEMVVSFLDGDKRNIEPENLMLISRAELLRLNQRGYKNAPADLKPSVLALAKLEVKTFSKQKDV